MRALKRSQLVYFPLATGAGAETLFPQVNNLDGADVEIYGLITYTSSELVTTPDLNSAGTLTLTEAAKTVITLSDGSDQKFQQIPYLDANRAINGGIWLELEPLTLTWQKCKVKNVDALGAGYSFAASFLYRLKSER